MRTHRQKAWRLPLVLGALLLVLGSSVLAATPPSVQPIAPQTTAEDTPTGPIWFNITDDTTPEDQLEVSASSDDQTLVPDENITLGGADADRFVDIEPAANQHGLTTITITVVDPVDGPSQTSFALEVTAVNDTPTISSIPNQETIQNQPTGEIEFTVGDVETDAADLTVTAVSNEQDLVPNSNIELGGSGVNRTINVTPAEGQTGTAQITVSASDGGETGTELFTLTVNANQAPTISPIPDQEIDEDASTGIIGFTVDDAETPADELVVTAVSSNTTLVPKANIELGGTGTDRTVSVTPMPDKNGTANITLTVSDGGKTDAETFEVLVNAVNDPPTISEIPDQVTQENVTTDDIPFTVDDIDDNDPPASLQTVASSSNTTLVPNENISIAGTGAERTLTITPAEGESGFTTIEVVVSDGEDVAIEAFQLEVEPVDDPPTISEIPDQETDEDTPTGPIPFTVDDGDTPLEELLVSAVSSNPEVVTNNGLTISGSGAERTLVAEPLPGASGTTTITVRVDDGTTVVSEEFELLVRAVNDAPTLDLNGPAAGTDTSAIYSTAGQPVLLAGTDTAITDEDNEELVSATATITNLLNGGSEKLVATTTGTNIVASYAGGVLSLSGVDTLENYEQVLRSITYHNTAQPPDTSSRTIVFTVSDGTDSSNSARSVVELINPRILVELTPDAQTIASGGTAVFTVRVRNIGNTTLNNVQVRSPQVPACNGSWATLASNQQQIYSCSSLNVRSEFTNQINASAADSLGNGVSSSDSGRVSVENPNVQIIKSPPTQTVRRGETASFEVFLFNTSSVVDLVDVEISDPLAPDCSRTGTHEFDDLDAGEQASYTCALNNVQAAFTNVITIRARNLLTGEEVEDSSTATVELLDLALAAEAVPGEMPEPGGPVTFTLTVTNPGSVDVTLNALSSGQFGDLLAASSNSDGVSDNSCAQESPPALGKNGGTFSCSFVGTLTGSTGELSTAFTAVAGDNDGKQVSANDTAVVQIIDVPGIDLQISSSPAQVEAPGGYVDVTVNIISTSEQARITIYTLRDSHVGDLNGQGTCATPLELAPLASYSCTYRTRISGKIGDDVRRSVLATGATDAPSTVGSTESYSVRIISPAIRQVLLPAVARNYVQPNEPNNSCPQAYPLALEREYRFSANDQYDWYVFEPPRAGSVSVNLTNFMPERGQLVIYQGSSCRQLTFVANNGNFEPNKTILLNALPVTRYYILVLNDDGQAYDAAYLLRVSLR